LTQKKRNAKRKGKITTMQNSLQTAFHIIFAKDFVAKRVHKLPQLLNLLLLFLQNQQQKPKFRVKIAIGNVAETLNEIVYFLRHTFFLLLLVLAKA